MHKIEYRYVIYFYTLREFISNFIVTDNNVSGYLVYFRFFVCCCIVYTCMLYDSCRLEHTRSLRRRLSTCADDINS